MQCIHRMSYPSDRGGKCKKCGSHIEEMDLCYIYHYLYPSEWADRSVESAQSTGCSFTLLCHKQRTVQTKGVSLQRNDSFWHWQTHCWTFWGWICLHMVFWCLHYRAANKWDGRADVYSVMKKCGTHPLGFCLTWHQMCKFTFIRSHQQFIGPSALNMPHFLN